MACSVSHSDDEIQALVQKQIDEDMVRQKAILDFALQFDNACTAKDLRNAYEKYGGLMSTQEYTQNVVEDVGEDDDFKSGSWVSATNYVNAFGGTVTGCTIPETISHKVIDAGGYEKDITVEVVMILANVSVFTFKPSKHYINITMRNVVEVFRKDTVPESDSG
uniref:Homologous recombination OB-fold protein OB-fold domain-containing protein n=1 Tax=Tanacetum cinerariifolium TaxID=118510 RepID=A0A6L2LH79_TANCI|nr:hypothetical protein [Tanacetum cinerariifolium]